MEKMVRFRYGSLLEKEIAREEQAFSEFRRVYAIGVKRIGQL
jgi:hypothetical protein